MPSSHNVELKFITCTLQATLGMVLLHRAPPPAPPRPRREIIDVMECCPTFLQELVYINRAYILPRKPGYVVLHCFDHGD